MLHRNDYKKKLSSSSSDLSDEDIAPHEPTFQSLQHRKIEQRYSKQDEEDSLSEDDSSISSPRHLSKKIGIQNSFKRATEQAEDSDRSIDQIEKRIKKLEKDLEGRIDKHKAQCKQEKAKAVRNISSPPLPKKAQLGSGSHSRRQQQRFHSGNVNQSKPKLQAEIEAQKQKKKEESQKQTNKIKPQNKTQSNLVKTPVKGSNQKSRIDSKNQNHEPVHGHHAQQLKKANKQIQELNKTIEQLRTQNERLRKQVNHYKKKRPIQEVDRLKQLSGQQGNAKLDKQIELLKIIEGLQGKIKRSINKKLNKNKTASTSSALLHKGLPANTLS